MSKLLQFLKGKGRHGRRGEDYEGRKKAEKKASPLSSGYNSDDEDAGSIADRPHADQLPAALTEGPTCQMSPKPFYDYTRLQQCYPGYLEMLKTSITMSLEKSKVNVAEVSVVLPSGLTPPIECDQRKEGAAVYRYNDVGPYSSKHQIWSSLGLMLYEFGNCNYGVFTLNMRRNYALTLEQNPSDRTQATVCFKGVSSLNEVQQFRMTGTFDTLQLSATIGEVTYSLYAEPPPGEVKDSDKRVPGEVHDKQDTVYGTLTAVRNSELKRVLGNKGGTVNFAFYPPLNMKSSC